MPELLVDFITSLDGYASAEGWPGWWGLQGPEYLAWLGEQPDGPRPVIIGHSCSRGRFGMSVFGAERTPGDSAKHPGSSPTSGRRSSVKRPIRR